MRILWFLLLLAKTKAGCNPRGNANEKPHFVRERIIDQNIDKYEFEWKHLVRKPECVTNTILYINGNKAMETGSQTSAPLTYTTTVPTCEPTRFNVGLEIEWERRGDTMFLSWPATENRVYNIQQTLPPKEQILNLPLDLNHTFPLKKETNCIGG